MKLTVYGSSPPCHSPVTAIVNIGRRHSQGLSGLAKRVEESKGKPVGKERVIYFEADDLSIL